MFINSGHPLFFPMVGGAIMWLCGLLIVPLAFDVPPGCLNCSWGLFLFGLITAFIRHPGE